jgi:hypothetical protein
MNKKISDLFWSVVFFGVVIWTCLEGGASHWQAVVSAAVLLILRDIRDILQARDILLANTPPNKRGERV